jgi:hydroxymethylpyrimidine/phosphomethylpyrimidine kinase
VAGSDSGGGAGIQADLKTMEAHGAFGTSVVTAVTAQHTRGVESSHVLPTAEIESQLDAVLSDFDVRAVKTGMLATEPVVSLVAERFAAHDGPLVVDPVMVATSGDRLLDAAAEAAYEDLVAAATLVTPNTDEATVLTGVEVTDAASAREAGTALVEMGTEAALVKGGHLAGEDVVDTLVTADGTETFTHDRVDTAATHGSGCTLSSAVAARLAHGAPLAEAVEDATAFMERAVRYALDVGQGPGAVHHLSALREQADRAGTSAAVADLARALVGDGVAPLVAPVGMAVVGGGRFSETAAETVGVDGRLVATVDGVRAAGGVRAGAGGDVTDYLLGAREVAPDRRFAVNCRYDADVADALDVLDGVVAEVDRPGPDEGGLAGAVHAAAADALSVAPEADLVGVIDAAGVRTVPQVVVLAADAATLRERVLSLRDAVAG